jgi:diguanylate cyclase (GGDEF)-like protein/PAS domain S-box-containing protein
MPEDANFYKDIVDNMYDGVYFVDRNRVITYWNKGAERITGYTVSRVIGHACHENLLNHVDANGVQLCLGQCPLAACMEDGDIREADVFMHHADGHRLPVLVRVSPLKDAQENIIGAVETFTNDLGVKAVRRELRELRRTAQIDRLTGIGNRVFLEGRLRAVIAEYKYRTDTKAGLIFLDIDHFKHVNDTFGHDAGDKVLCMVSTTLQVNLRSSDIVGRWGGEEFLVILNNVVAWDMVRTIAEKLRMLIQYSRLDLDVGSISVTISAGATLLRPEDIPDSIIQRADQLMYQSKNAGRNHVTVG